MCCRDAPLFWTETTVGCRPRFRMTMERRDALLSGRQIERALRTAAIAPARGIAPLAQNTPAASAESREPLPAGHPFDRPSGSPRLNTYGINGRAVEEMTSSPVED